MLSKLQYISQGNDAFEHLNNIKFALFAGIKWIQLRLKNITHNDYVYFGKEAKKLCNQFHAVLIINDNPFVAEECNANGVHLGLNDMSISRAREILGTKKIFGATANTFEDIQRANKYSPSYIGLGPLRYTDTKKNLSPLLGFNGYKNILIKMRQNNIDLPVFAIGGVISDDIVNLIQMGIHGIAVSGLITNSDSKNDLIKELNNKLNYVEDCR